MPTALLIKHGVLPLGFKTEFHFFRKRKVLNLGLLNPEATDLKEIKEAAKKSLGEDAFSNVQVFKIDAEAFVKVLEKHYGIKKESLEAIASGEAHPTLREHILLERHLS